METNVEGTYLKTLILNEIRRLKHTIFMHESGTVTREAPRSPVKSLERMEGGVITYTQANTKKTIMYFLKDCEKPPRVGDNVRFDICQVSSIHHKFWQHYPLIPFIWYSV